MERWGARSGGERRPGSVGADHGSAAANGPPVRVLVAGESEGAVPGIAEMLDGEPGIRVVASVVDDAIEAVREENPDIVCLDLQAPEMDALGFLEDLMVSHPTPVVVVSNGHSKAEVFRALELGALEFVTRPPDLGGVPAFQDDLRARVHMVRGLKRDVLEVPGDGARPERAAPERLVVVGGTGAEPDELAAVLADLPPGMLVSVVVAQHAPTAALTVSLAGRSWGLRVSEAGDGRSLEVGDVLVAPVGRHLQVERSRGTVSVRVLEPSEVAGRRHCPSIDLLFESAARSFADRACGVLLAGANGDGRRGAVAIRAAGGLVLAERRGAEGEADPELLARFDEVLGRADISRRLVRFARGE
jgi:two-component system, chemotaxis family, protein-glutamate methylesterase/glutaminase